GERDHAGAASYGDSEEGRAVVKGMHECDSLLANIAAQGASDGEGVPSQIRTQRELDHRDTFGAQLVHVESAEDAGDVREETPAIQRTRQAGKLAFTSAVSQRVNEQKARGRAAQHFSASAKSSISEACLWRSTSSKPLVILRSTET